MREMRSNDGGLMVETELHGALIDELEGMGLLTPRPDVVDVPHPHPNHGWSAMEADFLAIVDRLNALGWCLLDTRGEYDQYDQPYNRPAMEGPSYLLRRLP